jgi:hypothetical protein
MQSDQQYLLYIQFESTVVCQTIGIPMVNNCVPLLADSFFLRYEYKYLAQLVQTDIHKAGTFNLSYRYTAYSTDIRKHFNRISQRTVLRETTDILDLFLSIDGDRLSIRIYDNVQLPYCQCSVSQHTDTTCLVFSVYVSVQDMLVHAHSTRMSAFNYWLKDSCLRIICLVSFVEQ